MHVHNQPLFDVGDTPSLEQVLTNRERRVSLMHALLDKYPNDMVIILKCNIPGSVKNNNTIYAIFEEGMKCIKNNIQRKPYPILYEKMINATTGPEYLCVISSHEPIEAKKQMVQLEDEEVYGRLWDIDCYVKEASEYISISRDDINRKERTCLICNQSAKVCAGRRVHSVEELHEKIVEIVKEGVLYE